MLAVLLMIAVAVAAALITYAWVMTYLSTTTGRAGHAIQIQSVDFANGKLYVQNVGDGAVIITELYADGALVGAGGIDETVFEGDTFGIPITAYGVGAEVHFKVVCEDGTFTEGTYTYSG